MERLFSLIRRMKTDHTTHPMDKLLRRAIRPRITKGASMRSCRRAATKVMVFQWPCGTLATSLLRALPIP